MSVNFVDALLGYEFYLDSRGTATMEQVNEYLQLQRRPLIALRTYQHYKKLISHGFRSYISINKFDVFQSLGRLKMAADRRRFSRQKSDKPAEISRNKQNWHPCTIIDVSLVGFGVKTVEKFPIRPGNLVWLRMEQYEPIPCFVAWRRHETEITKIGLRAQEFIEHYRISEPDEVSERLTGKYIIVRKEDSDIDWAYLVTYLEKSDELISSVKELIIAVAETVDRNVIIPRSVLDNIHFGSPGGAEIKIDFGIADIIKTLIDFMQTFGLQRKRYRTETEVIELENQQKSLENAQLRIEVTRNAINLSQEAYSQGIDPSILRDMLAPSLMNALQVEKLPESIFEKNTLEKGIFDERIIPALAEVTSGDDPSYHIDVKVDGLSVTNINTDGGGYVGGNVSTEKGFTGRDKSKYATGES